MNFLLFLSSLGISGFTTYLVTYLQKTFHRWLSTETFTTVTFKAKTICWCTWNVSHLPTPVYRIEFMQFNFTPTSLPKCRHSSCAEEWQQKMELAFWNSHLRSKWNFFVVAYPLWDCKLHRQVRSMSLIIA